MSDEKWPAPTPRDEMLARVATRGTRIRAVRGAVNALVILSVVGASAFGVGAAIDGIGDGGSTEVENIAVGPEPPETDVVEPTGSTPTSGGTTPTSAGPTTSGPGTTGVPGTTTGTGGTGTTDGVVTPGTGGRGSSTTTGSTTPRPSTTEPVTTTTQRPTTTEPVTTTTQIPAPVVGTMRTKVDDGVPTGLSLCDDPTAVLAVTIEGAERAKVTWNRAGQSRSAEMTAGASEWSAPIPEIDEQAPDVPVIVTVEATGPGGTTRESVTIPVADCTPPTA